MFVSQNSSMLLLLVMVVNAGDEGRNQNNKRVASTEKQIVQCEVIMHFTLMTLHYTVDS